MLLARCPSRLFQSCLALASCFQSPLLNGGEHLAQRVSHHLDMKMAGPEPKSTTSAAELRWAHGAAARSAAIFSLGMAKR